MQRIRYMVFTFMAHGKVFSVAKKTLSDNVSSFFFLFLSLTDLHHLGPYNLWSNPELGRVAMSSISIYESLWGGLGMSKELKISSCQWLSAYSLTPLTGAGLLRCSYIKQGVVKLYISQTWWINPFFCFFPIYHICMNDISHFRRRETSTSHIGIFHLLQTSRTDRLGVHQALLK